MAWNGQNHTDVVAAAKAELEAQGVDLSTECGAHAITNLTALKLANEEAGCVERTIGTNCQGRSVDKLMYHDGTAFDILIASQERNQPAWQPIERLDPDLWLAPIPKPGPSPEPEPDPGECHCEGQIAVVNQNVTNGFDTIQRELGELEERMTIALKVFGAEAVQRFDKIDLGIAAVKKDTAAILKAVTTKK